MAGFITTIMLLIYHHQVEAYEVDVTRLKEENMNQEDTIHMQVTKLFICVTKMIVEFAVCKHASFHHQT